MLEFKPEYRNPLTIRLAESLALLESIAVSLIQNKQPQYTNAGKELLNLLSPISGLANDMGKFLQSIGINTDAGLEEQAVLLLRSILEDVNHLVLEWDAGRHKNESGLIHANEEPITRYELVNITEETVKVSTLLIKALDDPDLIKIIEMLVPDGVELESVEEEEKLKEYIRSYQLNLRKQVNERVPEYLFQLMGEYWEIRFGDDIIRLKDSKGLKYINVLLKNPYQPIRSDTLTAPHVNVTSSNREDTSNQVMEKEAPRVRHAPDTVYVNMTNKIKELEEIVLQLTPGSDKYFLAEEHIIAERKKRSKYFNRAGQERPHDSGEKARQAVYTAITTAKKRINNSLPALFAHLQRYLNTGFECIYDPPPSELKSWQL